MPGRVHKPQTSLIEDEVIPGPGTLSSLTLWFDVICFRHHPPTRSQKIPTNTEEKIQRNESSLLACRMTKAKRLVMAIEGRQCKNSVSPILHAATWQHRPKALTLHQIHGQISLQGKILCYC